MKSSLALSVEPRIEILDGFRAIAVMAVVAHHYFYCYQWMLNNPEYPDWYFFAFGYFGLNLFFMISGFVIYRSLEQSYNINEFLAKRYLRLAPALILGSIITYTLVFTMPVPEGSENFGTESPANFLFTFTFVHPDIWNGLLGRIDIGYIDRAYWTLWIEVVFYVTASIIYFSSRNDNFLRNWFVLVLVTGIAGLIVSRNQIDVIPGYWIYFSMGILFYSLWKRKKNPSTLVWVIAALMFGLEMYRINSNGVRLLFPMVIGVWIIFLRRPTWLQFLQWKPIQIIGLISYPLYLLHFYAGLVLTQKLIVWTNHSVPVALLLIFVLVLFILLAYFVVTFFEKPVTKTLREKFLRPRSLQA